jgi:hypothetical protein
MPNTSIEKIVFNVRGKSLELTQEEAKELKQILSDLFGETKVVHEWHTSPSYPYRWPYVTWGGTYSMGAGQTLTASCVPVASDTLYLTVN